MDIEVRSIMVILMLTKALRCPRFSSFKILKPETVTELQSSEGYYTRKMWTGEVLFTALLVIISSSYGADWDYRDIFLVDLVISFLTTLP